MQLKQRVLRAWHAQRLLQGAAGAGISGEVEQEEENTGRVWQPLVLNLCHIDER